MNNDAYASALAEIEEGRMDRGVWARSFAESGGDESKAKALYIKTRAESMKDAVVWQDTRPPGAEDAGIEATTPRVDSEGYVAQGIHSAEHSPDASPASPYEAAIGERNQSYYLSKFEDFDKQGPDHHASWNWAAFFFTGYWALYRKMYGWFFAWLVGITFIGIISKNQSVDAARGLLLVNVILWLVFTAYANSLYHRKVKARIAAAHKQTSDAGRVSRRLSAGGGVHMWVPIGLGGLTVLGVVAAVALPAYEDYTKRQMVAVSAVDQKVPDWDKGVITPPAKPADKLPMADMSQFTSENQKRLADEALGRGDYASALSLLNILASQGVEAAQFNLGVMYGEGQGVAQNYAESAKWFELAAAQGNTSAQFNLGVMYDNGQGVVQNYAESVKWYRLAAANGHAGSQLNLGVMYAKGQGVAQNYAESVKWYRLAADQGNATAQATLGKFYDTGRRVAQNYAEALKWYRLAAAQGDTDAQLGLGFMYSLGHGVPEDLIRAHMWSSLGAVSGNAIALEIRENNAKSMTSQQLAQAQQMARDCQQRNFKGCD